MTTATVPHQINDICPSCTPVKYTKTTATFINQVCDIADEFLYQCDDCSARLWVDSQWAIQNAYQQMETVYKSLEDFK